MNAGTVITGGGGFIGSRLVAGLVGEGDIPVVIDPRPGADVRECARQGTVRLVESADFESRDIQAVLAQADTLVHLAAVMDDSDDVLRDGPASVEGNLVSLTQLLANAPRLRHVIFASTIMVYADPPAYAPIDEQHPTVPSNVYGATKLAAERYLEVHGRQSGVGVTVLRLCGAFGPGAQAPSMRHRAIPRFIEAVEAGVPPRVFGDGSERRDYVYVDDVASAIRTAMRRRVSGTFNIGSGNPVSVLELARLIVRVMDARVEPVLVPERPAGGDYSVDITKARRELGFEPSHGLREGLAREIAWHRSMSIG